MVNIIKDNRSNLVINNIDNTKNKRIKNLLTAINKAFDELNTTTEWTALTPGEVSYSCCSSCIFGSTQFDDRENAITFNDQDLNDYRRNYKDNRRDDYKQKSYRGESIYLQHRGTSHKNYKELIQILNKHGIYADWNWSSDLKIKVLLGKYKEEVL
tara:strand:+ start:871 stop:1338 length:468 start_codon:yes stop_codon:yes gene_type:complete